MNQMVDRYFNDLAGKSIAVLGIGVSNRPLIRLLLSYGLQVTACDRTPREQLDAEVLELEAAGAVLKVGPAYLEGLSADIVFRTPGMHPNIPALCMLRDGGAVITSEMEAFFAVCPCPIIAVTGSDGKTTTTTLIAEMLKQSGKKVWIGGNIGNPLLPAAAEMKITDIAVVELSSFQLMNMKQSPSVAVVTNLAPNHLDVHKDMDEYIQAKENIYLHQSKSDRIVLNLDNEITAGFSSKAVGEVSFFSRLQEPKNGVWFHENIIWRGNTPVLNRSDILIPGLHNVENYMAAICAVEGLVSDEDIRIVARTFGGVEHRIELVREFQGVRYYNDSIASSPTRTIAGLHAFDQKVILIAGGYDKQLPFDVLGPEIVRHVKALILCGATADKIKKAVMEAPGFHEGNPIIVTADRLSDAVEAAKEIAIPGDVVTLSPACAAFDQFKNFMVRGAVFKDLVRSLK